MENVKYLSLYQHILHNILANDQYGFRHNSLTENTCYKLTNDISLALNNKLLKNVLIFISIVNAPEGI